MKELLCESWDVIVDFMIYKEIEFKERIDLMLDATSHYIFLSSSRVYNESHVPITEGTARLLDNSADAEYLSTTEYALSKARQENMLVTSSRKNWTIVRPYITYSEKRMQLGNLEKENWLYRALQGRTIVFSEDIKEHLTTLTYGLDVSKGIASLLHNPKAFGEIYHITNETSVKWDDVLGIYLNVLEEKTGKRPKVIYQELSDYLTWNKGKYQIIYDRLFNRRFDNKKINDFVNTKEFISVQNGLRSCLIKFLDNPEFLNINWRSEAIKDRYTNERTLLKEIKGFKQKIEYLTYRYLKRSFIKATESFLYNLNRSRD